MTRGTSLSVSTDGRLAAVSGFSGVTLIALDGSRLIAESVPVPRSGAPSALFLSPDDGSLLRVVADADKALPLVPPLIRLDEGGPSIDLRVPEDSGLYFWFDRVTG